MTNPPASQSGAIPGALATQRPADVVVDRKLFCPVAGESTAASTATPGTTQEILGSRLFATAVIFFLAFCAFLVRNFIVGMEHVGEQETAPVVQAAAILAMAGFAWLAKSGRLSSLQQLRWLELAIFGTAALFFSWFSFRCCSVCASHGDHGMVSAYLARICFPWISLIYVYGLFIPNSVRRAAVAVSLMAIAPFITAFAAGYQHPVVLDSLYEGDLSLMALWLGISLVTAIVGAQMLNNLRREASTARQMGSYHLKRLLGKGGMGEVYLAEHTFLKRACAIKLIRANQAEDPKAVARFESEVQATARLTHWNTVEIFDYGRTEDGTFYYAMEYLPGLNLQDIVDQYGPLPPERAIHFLRQVCAALREAHSIGLIHRDIKPGNIFAARLGGVYDVAKLLDFGLVKSVADKDRSLKLTLEGMVIGSPLYVAPEITLGESAPDARSDIYSLGAVAYFLLTGRPVFEHSNALKVIFAHAKEEVVSPSRHRPGLPVDLVAVVLKCLEKRPADRFTDVGALDRALAGCAHSGDWTQDSAAQWWTDVPDSVGCVGEDSPIHDTSFPTEAVRTR